jgi:hypothetical protein
MPFNDFRDKIFESLTLERNHNVELRNADDLYVPLARSDQAKKLPFIAFANLWNSLPYDKYHANPVTFRIALNNHIWYQINGDFNFNNNRI